MMRLVFNTMIITCLTVLSLSAQVTSADSSSISSLIVKNIALKKLKDSTAVYSFTLKVNLSDLDKAKASAVSINNQTIDAIFNGKEKLAGLDYSKISAQGYKGIMIKGIIMILSSDYEPKTIDAYCIPDIISKFSNAGQEVLDLGFIILQYDKKEYD